MKTLIIGCGYVGIPLGEELFRQGHEVFGLRRTDHADPELQKAGIHPLHADISDRESLRQLPNPDFDWVVNCAASSGGGIEGYRKTYLEGAQNLLAWLAAKPPGKYVYTGSTSVYGQSDGSPVREGDPTKPLGETAKILVETEQFLLNAFREKGFPSILLRVAGIFGPGRGYFFKQFLNGSAKIPGSGGRYLNMIHRDDVIGVIICALENGKPGQIYNAVDDEPVTILHFYRWLADTLNRPMPPREPQCDQAVNPNRTPTNKRVLNRKLKMELGYSFKFPTFREGYEHEIARLDQEGFPAEP